MRIGVLTGGGDCAGLNAALRAVVRMAGHLLDRSVVGYRRGWNGVLDGDAVTLDAEAMRGVLSRGGTMLGTSRSSRRLQTEGTAPLLAQLERDGVEGLVTIGGDGTLITARRLSDAGFPVVAVPKTIDNDVCGTDSCIGFDTALGVATEAVDRLHTTAESHNRIMVLEVMGREAGHIAAGAGIAGGAAAVLVPETPFDIDEIAERLIARHHRDRNASIVVVAEGAVPDGSVEAPDTGTDEWGNRILDGMGQFVGDLLAERTGFETRTTVLGYIQRGGPPSPADRLLGSRLGARAVEALAGGRSGRLVGVCSTGIAYSPLAEVAGRTRYLSADQLELLDYISTAPALTRRSDGRRWF
ncbi:6-phosphofructokinase [Candidatus Poriferisodalis sp.]|uniref:6-phosphofructokinase n=1 Tax=Candidatus Poriferisodalis sp. TaxID=3101277 RepID=UPI003B014578